MKGKLIQNGVFLQKHEWKTIKVFLNQGKDITLQPPNQSKNERSADFWMDGVLWEMKSPQGKGKNTIHNIIRKASHQSANIIIDLSRRKIPTEQVIDELEKEFALSKRIKRLKIVVDNNNVIDLNKK